MPPFTELVSSGCSTAIASGSLGVPFHLTTVRLPDWLYYSALLLVIAPFFVKAVSSAKLLNTMKPQNWQRISVSLLLVSTLLFSLVSIEGLYLQDPFSSISADEKNIAQYLNGLGDSGIVFVFSMEIGRRLEAYGIPAIHSFNENAAPYFGWINESEILENTVIHFDAYWFIRTAQLYDYRGIWPERNLTDSVFNLNLANQTEFGWILDAGIRFAVVEKLGSAYGDNFYWSREPMYCEFLHSVPQAGELVYCGSEMALFRLGD